MLPSNCIMRMTELRKKAMATQLAAIPRGRNRAMRTLVLDILPPDLRTFPAEKATPAESAERGTRRWVPWRRRLLGPPLVVQIDRWWSVAVGAAIAAADQVHRALPRHVCLPPGPLHPKAAPVAHDVLRLGRRVAAWAKLASAKITDPRSIGEAIFCRGGGILFLPTSPTMHCSIDQRLRTFETCAIQHQVPRVVDSMWSSFLVTAVKELRRAGRARVLVSAKGPPADVSPSRRGHILHLPQRRWWRRCLRPR